MSTDTPRDTTSHAAGARWFYVVAVIATLVSVDTSWRFFGERLGITGWERPMMFAVIELTFIACARSMHGSVSRGGGPGPARLLVWALCGASAYMAITLAGPVDGLARVLLGPVLAVVTLHLALGIQIRARRGQRSGTWARIGREMRERLLSRMGLADDARDALARTQDRAADRAARLATASWTPLRTRRLARAVRASGAALDPVRRERVLAGVAALKGLQDLTTGTFASPWVQVTEVPAVPFVSPVPAEVLDLQTLAPVPPVSRVLPARVERDLVRAPRVSAGSWDQVKAVRMVLDGVQGNADIASAVGTSPKTIQRVRRAALLLLEDHAAVVPADWKVLPAVVDLIRAEVTR